jgi:hypothetical protein
VTPAPGSPTDGWPWPVASLPAFPAGTEGAPEVRWPAEELDGDTGEEAVVVVSGVPVLQLAGAVGEVAVALGVDTVGVGLLGRGTVPVAEAAPGVLGARAAAGFAVEDGAAL